MSQRTIPVEVAQRIACSTDRQGLTILARTSRSLQTAAEKLLYETIEIIHSPAAFAVCHTLATCPRVAGYVHTFMLAMINHRIRDHDRDHTYYLMQQTAASRDYWEVVRKALENLRTLDYLFLSDPTLRNSWVLRPTDNWTLRAHEIRLYLPWDEHIARFLETQDEVRMLTIGEVAENVPVAPLSNSALPYLTHFEGPLILIDQLLHCPITHLKLPVNTEDAVSLLPLVLPELRHFKKLRNLNIVPISQEMLLPSLATIATACPNLRYLSHLPLPIEHKDRIAFLQYLAHFHELTILEVDVSHWVPQMSGIYQRIFAIEIRMVVPKARYIFFYNKTDRWMWTWESDSVEPVRHQQFSAGDREAGSTGEEEEQPYAIGLEGWTYQITHPHWSTHSNLWRNI